MTELRMDQRLDGGRAWSIAFLLFLSQVINYFDKSVMGLAAPSIMAELGLSPAQYGLVASSFFALYAVSGLTVGLFVAHRVRSKPLLAVLVLIWSLAQLPIAFFPSLAVLVAARVLLGIGEGPASPTATSAALEWFSPDNRNMPTALLILGSSLGSVIAGPVLSYVIADHGWRAGFVLCSGLGIAWLALWLGFGANGPQSVPPVAAAPVPVPAASRSIWRDETVVASIVVGFCAYWVVGFTVPWLAPFVRLGLGYDAKTTGWIVSAVSATSSVLIVSISFLSQVMLKRGSSSRIARGWVNAACMGASGLALAGAALVGAPVTKLVLLAIGGALPLLTFTLGPALVSAIAPPAQRTRLLISIYAGITIAGFLSPLLAGWLIGDRGIAGYDAALLANAMVVIVGGMVAALWLRPDRTAVRFSI